MKTTRVFVCGNKWIPDSSNMEFFHHCHIQREHLLQTKQVLHKDWIFSRSLPGIGCTTSPCYEEYLADKAPANPIGQLKGLVHTVGSPGKCILYVWFVKAVANAHNSANCEYAPKCTVQMSVDSASLDWAHSRQVDFKVIHQHRQVQWDEILYFKDRGVTKDENVCDT